VVATLLALTLLSSTAVALAAGNPATTLVPQPTPAKVVAEHLAALNACDINRLMAQFPKTAVFGYAGGSMTAGRWAIRRLWEGFCMPPAQGGLRGLTFKTVKVWTVGGTLTFSWAVTAPFLTKPYYGTDVVVTQNGLIAVQVSTLNPALLPFTPAPAPTPTPTPTPTPKP
jgi:hypothetical protein